jgi:hypothetical protein
MNQNSHTFRLHDFLVGGEGWGAKAGVVARKKLQQRLDGFASAQVIRLSMTGVRKLDVSFALEGICEIVSEYLGKCGFCLVDLGDEDVRLNVRAAAILSGIPLTLWHGGKVEVAGPSLGPGLRMALALALERGQLRTADLVREKGLAKTAASNLVRRLARRGYLLRYASTAPSGGSEFVYRCIG